MRGQEIHNSGIALFFVQDFCIILVVLFDVIQSNCSYMHASKRARLGPVLIRQFDCSK